LHHPFDASTFVAQQRSLDHDVVILPGPLVTQFAEAGCLIPESGLESVIGVWRAPERLPRAPAWRNRTIGLIDVQVFGEIGLIPARRSAAGRPGTVPFGPQTAPRGARNGVIVSEIRPTPNGTVAMRGPMVSRSPFPPGVERTPLPHLKVGANGFVDTGYACWSDRDNAPLIVTGPPPGMISVGGYRFVMRDLQDAVGAVDAGATLAALPDALVGHRLAGAAPDPARMQQSLAGHGVNPLLVNAFRERKSDARA
jgi:hypothetical protein